MAHWRRVDLDGRVLPEEEEVVVSGHIGKSASAGYERHKKSVRHGGVGGALRYLCEGAISIFNSVPRSADYF